MRRCVARPIILALVGGGSLGFLPSARAQDCVDYAGFLVTPTRIELPGTAADLLLAGNRLWVAAGDEGLLVYRVDDPFAPEILAHAPTAGGARAVAVAGHRACVAEGLAGLEIFDVEDPASPIPRGRLDTPGEACDVEVVGTIAYVADTARGIAVVDVSDPAAPSLVTTVEAGATVSGLDVAGNVLLAAEFYRLAVLDITTPASPALADTRGMSPPPIMVSAEGHHAFVLDYLAHVRVVDFADPYNVTGGLYGTSMTGANHGFDIATAGKLGLVLDNFGLELLDLTPVLGGSHPEHPLPVASLPVTGACVALDAEREVAYAGGDDLMVIDLSHSPSPPVIATQPVIYWPHSFAAVGDTLYYVEGGCCYWSRLVVVVAEDPDAPAIVSEFDFGRGPFLDISVSGHHAFIADEGVGEHIGTEPALRVIDIADPRAPVLVGSLLLEPFWNSPVAVAADGDLALLATAFEGLMLLDVSTPAAPAPLITLDLFARDILLRNARAILAAGPGLIILDVSDPLAPKEVASLGLPRPGSLLVPAKDLLYVLATPEYGAGAVAVAVVDVSDLEAPVLLGSLEWQGRAKGLAVRDGHAYVTLWEEGLAVLDVSAPAELRRVGALRLLGYGGSATTHRGRLLVTVLGFDRGLRVLPLQCPALSAVEIASFTAAAEEGSIVLRWTAARAADHLGYRIERSMDRERAFVPVGPPLIECSSPCSWADTGVVPAMTYRYRLVAIDLRGGEQAFGPIAVRSRPRATWSLAQSHPNPGHATTVIPFAIGTREVVQVRIYDVSGRLVRVLLDERMGAGEHRVSWDGRDDAGNRLGPGTYLYRLDAGSYSASRKLVLEP